MDVDYDHFEILGVEEEVVPIQKSPKIKSPRSSNGGRRKRKYDEMEKEMVEHQNNEEVAMIDLSNEDQTETAEENTNNQLLAEQNENEQEQEQKVQPPSPKKMRFDPNASTLSQLAQISDFSDITFQVEDKQFHGLKAIFAIKSRIFKEMLFPRNNNGMPINYIQISDITGDAFQFIRDFFYDLNPQITFENVVNLLNASKIYQIDGIQTQCQEFLNKIDSVNHLLAILQSFGQSANILSDALNDLLGNNVDLLQNHGNDIIKSDIFKGLPFNMASKIISSDNLGCKEEDLWNESNVWLNTNGEELKCLIRFCAMDISFLYNTVKPCGILSDQDLCSIYEKKLGLNEGCNFNCNPRFIPKQKRSRRKSKGGKKKKEEKQQIVEETEENHNNDEQEENVEEKKETPKKRGRGRGRGRKKRSVSRGRSKSKGRKKKINSN